MDIKFTGDNIKITPSLREITLEKFKKLDHHGCHITSAQVVFRVEKLLQRAEATIHLNNYELCAHAESENMYTTIDRLVDKLNKQLIKHKEKTLDRRSE